MTENQRIKQFIIQNFYVSDPDGLRDDTLLVSTGLVDSTGMLEVIAFIESEFGIQITDQETTPENLESISRIAAFIERKRTRAASGGRPSALARRTDRAPA